MLCPHRETTWRKTSGTRRATIPCNNPCRSTFSGFKTLSQDHYTWIQLKWSLLSTILKRPIFLPVCNCLNYDSLHSEVQSILHNQRWSEHRQVLYKMGEKQMKMAYLKTFNTKLAHLKDLQTSICNGKVQDSVQFHNHVSTKCIFMSLRRI